MKCHKCNADNPDSQRFCGECGTPLPSSKEIPVTETLETPTEELKRGTIFASRYEIIEELGKGGMGKVYRVEDKKIKEEVALKLIKPEIASDKKTIERFSNELKMARKIAHRNVCRMYDLGEEQGTHYITMEYVPGEDLKGMIRMMGQLGAGKSISIAKQVCDGLAEAHRLGVVHRDLKPQNIMIDKEGNSRIMDFGIARSVKGKGITGAGVMVGTPEYMSPEQVEAKDVDQRSDIYSLGVILYEMLTGRVPFEGETPLSVAVKHKTEAPQDPKELNSQIPEELNNVILRCLEKNKEKRYQSSGEVRSELERIEKGIPTTEKVVPKKESATSKEITVTFQRRWVFIVAPIVIILVVALAFLLLTGGKDVAPLENKMIVVLPFENLGPPEDEYFANGITGDIRNRLSALPELEVISSTSANQYKKTEKTIRQIREELDVDYVVTGTVRWDKSEGERGRLLVSPQLIKASDDTQIWSEDYEESIEDIFGVQARISEEVVRRLDITLLEPERRALAAKPTDNLEAYDFYLRGEEHFDKVWSSLNYQEAKYAVEMLEKAIELDPDFVAAYIWLSYIHSAVFTYGIDRSEERLKKAKAAVDKALEIRPELPEANLCLAYYYFWGFLDHERALEIFESVQKVRPNVDLELKGKIQAAQGKFEEALESLEKAFKLDPRSTNDARSIGHIYENMRRYAEADAWYDRSLSLSPNNLATLSVKVLNSFMWKGNTQEARSILEKFPSGPIADLLWIEMDIRDRNYAEALQQLESLSLNSFGIANIYVHKDLKYAAVHHRQHEFSLMKSHADSARKILEDLVQKYPEDPKYHSALGLAFAYLGRKEDAIREGNLATKLHPVSKDANRGPSTVRELTKILIIVGEYDIALDKLEYLMSIPAGRDVSVHTLKLHSRYDPLRDHPRFKRLLEKYSKDNS